MGGEVREKATPEYEHHWILALQSRELPALRGMVRELVVGEDSPRNHIVSHKMPLTFFGQSFRSTMRRLMRSFSQTPKSYFFQDLDLIKTPKIIKCETSTMGA